MNLETTVRLTDNSGCGHPDAFGGLIFCTLGAMGLFF